MLGIATALLLAMNAAPAGACAGPDPAIVSDVVTAVNHDGALNHYVLQGTVVNRGTQGQPSNTLQSVDIYLNGVKVDRKGIPPLAAGAEYRFNYEMQRAADAAEGTTDVGMRLHVSQGSDCSTGDDVLKKSV